METPVTPLFPATPAHRKAGRRVVYVAPDEGPVPTKVAQAVAAREASRDRYYANRDEILVRVRANYHARMARFREALAKVAAAEAAPAPAPEAGA